MERDEVIKSILRILPEERIKQLKEVAWNLTMNTGKYDSSTLRSELTLSERALLAHFECEQTKEDCERRRKEIEQNIKKVIEETKKLKAEFGQTKYKDEASPSLNWLFVMGEA